jgi:hypothetical protein
MKVTGKWLNLVETCAVMRGSEVTHPLILNRGNARGKFHALTALHRGMRLWFLFNRKTVYPQRRSGRILPPTGNLKGAEISHSV